MAGAFWEFIIYANNQVYSTASRGFSLSLRLFDCENLLTELISDQTPARFRHLRAIILTLRKIPVICTSAGFLDGEQKKQKVSEIKAGLDDADALIRKMDLEARSLPPNVKAMLLAKLREYKTDLNNLKSQVKRITSANANQAARDELLKSGMADTNMVSADQKGRLLMSTERLNQSSDRIRESRTTMLETEELGVSILQDLHQQRQSLLHANNTLHGVDENISRSKKILTAMSRRMSRNKWIIGSIIAALVSCDHFDPLF
ncbi:hypothetical protein F0562_024873 [Nyssa sinensis]|uniref:Vesicle transport v-SNARE N-terminal domain-containing protein n=1 Tax=Nyssa sinensis TaxID=561372 RepID=A0A5J5BE30_9ASTE|nr:hypothetical protein F0562_024873 [Nyssa sinensis]